jgi:hypothetical protein
MAGKLADKNVGDQVKLYINKRLLNFYVVYKGNPDPDNYSDEMNGIWLQRVDLISENFNPFDYGIKNKFGWVVETTYSTVDSNQKDLIHNISSLPYSYTESESDHSYNKTVTDKHAFVYSYNDIQSIPYISQISFSNAINLRDGYANDDETVAYKWDGSFQKDTSGTSGSNKFAPVYIFDSDLSYVDNSNIVCKDTPTTPTLDIPTTIEGFQYFDITWTESTTFEETTMNYRLMYTVNGKTWPLYFTDETSGRWHTATYETDENGKGYYKMTAMIPVKGEAEVTFNLSVSCSNGYSTSTSVTRTLSPQTHTPVTPTYYKIPETSGNFNLQPGMVFTCEGWNYICDYPCTTHIPYIYPLYRLIGYKNCPTYVKPFRVLHGESDFKPNDGISLIHSSCNVDHDNVHIYLQFKVTNSTSSIGSLDGKFTPDLSTSDTLYFPIKVIDPTTTDKYFASDNLSVSISQDSDNLYTTAYLTASNTLDAGDNIYIIDINFNLEDYFYGTIV